MQIYLHIHRQIICIVFICILWYNGVERTESKHLFAYVQNVQKRTHVSNKCSWVLVRSGENAGYAYCE